jgi:hypothetical protein
MARKFLNISTGLVEFLLLMRRGACAKSRGLSRRKWFYTIALIEHSFAHSNTEIY